MSYIGELNADKEIIDGNRKIIIYGIGGYGDKIYRNLAIYDKQKNVMAFVDKSPERYRGGAFCSIPIISVEKAIKEYQDTIICIGGEMPENIKDLELLCGMNNIHQIVFNINCKLYGTEYGGFYLPVNFRIDNSIIYSFGIGEDISFSEAVIKAGGVVYAFDPTPKAIKYVEQHEIFSTPNFHFFPFGLSDKDEKEVFYLPKRQDWVSGSAILHQYVNGENIVEVEMKTLRSIMKELGHDHIDVLKMDIEGSEFKVTKNLMNPKLETIDFKVCLMETHERFFAPKEREYIDELYSIMRENGFYDLYGTAKEPTFINA